MVISKPNFIKDFDQVFKLANWLISTTVNFLPFLGVIFILYVIITDEFLSQYTFALIVLCIWFVANNYLLILSRICSIKRKPHVQHVPLEQLWDHELIIDNETENVPFESYSNVPCTQWLSLLLKNLREFCRFRPAYGMTFMTGVVFLVVMIVLRCRAEVWDTNDDYYTASNALFRMMLPLVAIVVLLAWSGCYNDEEETDSYSPFAASAQIPQRVLVGKTVAALANAGYVHTFFAAVLLVFALVSLVGLGSLYHRSEDEYYLTIQKLRLDRPLFFGLAVTALSCACMLYVLVLASYDKARRTVLGIMEKNWERNLVAAMCILKDINVDTLQDLEKALEEKRTRQLTKEEKQAFDYISRPLWKSKHPFVGRWPRAKTGFEVCPEDVPDAAKRKQRGQCNRDTLRESSKMQNGGIKVWQKVQSHQYVIKEVHDGLIYGIAIRRNEQDKSKQNQPSLDGNRKATVQGSQTNINEQQTNTMPKEIVKEQSKPSASTSQSGKQQTKKT